MSDTLTSVALSYHHDVLGVLQAQDRPRSSDREGAYLFREGNVRPGFYVHSLIKDSSMLAVPGKNGKFFRQTLEETCEVEEDIVNSSDGFLHPVPAPSPVLLQTSMKMSLVPKMGPNATILNEMIHIMSLPDYLSFYHLSRNDLKTQINCNFL